MSKPRPRSTAARLIATLREMAGEEAQIISAHEREWASATFGGARHSIMLRLPLAAIDAPVPRMLSTLPDHEFTLPGEIVADCTVALQGRSMDDAGQPWLCCTVELLTVSCRHRSQSPTTY